MPPHRHGLSWADWGQLCYCLRSDLPYCIQCLCEWGVLHDGAAAAASTALTGWPACSSVCVHAQPYRPLSMGFLSYGGSRGGGPHALAEDILASGCPVVQVPAILTCSRCPSCAAMARIQGVLAAQGPCAPGVPVKNQSSAECHCKWYKGRAVDDHHLPTPDLHPLSTLPIARKHYSALLSRLPPSRIRHHRTHGAANERV
jgi:hypothetical protein